MKEVISEYNGKEVRQMHFEAKLLSIGTKVLEFNTENKTQYVIGNIEYASIHGEVVRSSCVIYQKTLDHGMVVGESYIGVATPGIKSAFVVCTPMIYGGDYATNDAFGFVAEAIEDGIEVSQLAKAVEGEM